jgi:RimJ/RimL family protein N-acetyltransferase
MTTVSLRDVTPDDILIFYEQQRDPDAVHMAAFVPARDKAAHLAHWAKISKDKTAMNRTIVFDGQVVGFLVKFVMDGEPEVGYWLGKTFWGKGIATQALAAFLHIVTERPLFAHAAKDNLGSLRVLQKCGFVVIDQNRAFADGRHEEVDEMTLRLS